MRIAVPVEIDADEPRVAATAETVEKLIELGATVVVPRARGCDRASRMRITRGRRAISAIRPR